ncbi:PilZ domain-containing protein [Paractinoplanes rishiriensis]|uniref:PilZ domain-containing protein n=1 Tax=Paractinoplanes rishiriensis TaxID=1050105 RepID=A0A919JUS4_9ACTN|nr:PilZ domain-containing protein [Actinoplanes rishiriensis]GIE95596.1 hypothetical protein Ari01nite_30610 [Actinoplanes rishiriensis]
MVDLPRVGTPMYVVHAEGVNYRSRLEAVDGNKLSLAAPLETTGPEQPRPGHQLDVFWALPRARVILPCRLIEVVDNAPFRWVLEPIGTPKQSNRREYVRGGGGGPVRLAAEEGAEAVVGRLLDISEGGLRCWVARAPQVGTGDKMQASVPLGRRDVEVDGAVLSVRDAYDEPGQHLILTFAAGERVAKAIRQHVFAWEISERRRFEHG